MEIAIAHSVRLVMRPNCWTNEYMHNLWFSLCTQCLIAVAIGIIVCVICIIIIERQTLSQYNNDRKMCFSQGQEVCVTT